MDRLGSTSSGSSDASGQATVPSRPRHASLINQDGGGSHQAIKCPRCDSSNTKFCYYNNYSQTQPRHFCKSCRRYWTQGGSLRNVPIGGGCRKNKRVKHRPLMTMGGTAGLLDPCSFMDDTTANMLAKLSNSSTFPNFGPGGANFSDDANSQLLNIAFSHFQEQVRRRQQQQPSDQSPDHAAPFFDMSFPGLAHKQCGHPSCNCGACGSRSGALLHHGGLMNSFDNNMGFTTLPVKMEHDATMAGFCNPNYELNPNLYHEQSSNMHMVGTSATATLASIEDQLSNFSNLSHVDTAYNNAGVSSEDQDQDNTMLASGAAKRMVLAPLQLLGHGGSHNSSAERAGNALTDLSIDGSTEEKQLVMDEKPLLNNASNELSLMMPVDSWQPASFMNEMLYEPHHNMWNTHTQRWQDVHTLAATAATAGGVL